MGAFLLKTDHTGEQAVPLHKPGRGALFDNTSGVEHHHLVGVRHRAHAMRDHDDSLTGEQPRERLLHLCLILHVKRRGRLVEQYDRRALEQRPHN